MHESQLYGQGISFPPRIGPDGRMAWSSGGQNIAESIRVVLMTDAEERLMRPEFGGGLNSLLFEPNTTSTRRLIEERITQSLGRWEPRIAVENVRVEADSEDPQAVVATIEYRLVATGIRDRVGVTLQLNAA